MYSAVVLKRIGGLLCPERVGPALEYLQYVLSMLNRMPLERLPQQLFLDSDLDPSLALARLNTLDNRCLHA